MRQQHGGRQSVVGQGKLREAGIWAHAPQAKGGTEDRLLVLSGTYKKGCSSRHPGLSPPLTIPCAGGQR